MASSYPEVVMIGGGLIGLAIAWELRQAGARVKILSRDFKEAAGHAAAGMLAPQAERIPANTPLFDLCLESRQLYPQWIEALEAYTQLQAGYWPCGILAPSYDLQDAPQERKAPPSHPLCPAEWLSSRELAILQPGLSDRVVGGWWYPADAQVDNRALMHCLWMACTQSGVEIVEGVNVQQIQIQGDRVVGLTTSQGQEVAEHYILAAGAWSQQLFPVSVQPRKGQMLSLQVPREVLPGGLPLTTVLFGADIYIVPRQSGRIVLGATSEDVGFAPQNTAAGVQALLQAATQLVPALAHYPIEELWWGYRPTTPDEQPILGASPYPNLSLATGHHRNGVLLAPVTAKLMKDWILSRDLDPLLSPFQAASGGLKCWVG